MTVTFLPIFLNLNCNCVSYCNICIVYGFVMQINIELIISRKNQSKHTLFSSHISYMFPPNTVIRLVTKKKINTYIHSCIEIVISMYYMCCYIKNIYITEVDSSRNKNSKNCICSSLWNILMAWGKENTVTKPFKIFQKLIYLKFLLYLFPRVCTLLYIFSGLNPKTTLYICLFPVARLMRTIFENSALLGYYISSSGNSLRTFRDNYLSHLQGSRTQSSSKTVSPPPPFFLETINPHWCVTF